MKSVLLCLLIATFLWSTSFAHSGGTDKYGCHAGSKPYHCHKSKGVFRVEDGPIRSSKPITDPTSLTRNNIWQGIVIAPENRCSEFKRAHYLYPQSLEMKIIARDGWVSRYTGAVFANKDSTDIDHIVALSEAHDSGLCLSSPSERNEFANDLANLVLANPRVNRHEKSDKDAADWLPPKNLCWFAQQVITVKKKYGLTIDVEEREALKTALLTCGEATFKAGCPDQTDQEIKKILIQESIMAYSGSCPCPYNTDRGGRRCGGRSAWSRPGGADPLCYESDVSDYMVDRYRGRGECK